MMRRFISAEITGSQPSHRAPAVKEISGDPHGQQGLLEPIDCGRTVANRQLPRFRRLNLNHSLVDAVFDRRCSHWQRFMVA